MEVQQELLGNWQVIRVIGEIDSKTVTTLRDFIDDKLVSDKAVALDLKKVPWPRIPAVIPKTVKNLIFTK